MQREEIDLAYGAPVRAHLRHDARRQSDLTQPLQNPLAVPVVVRPIVENQLQIRKPEKRKRTQMHDLRDAVHHDLKRNRDLLLDLFRRNPRPLSDDLDVVVGYVGISLNRQPLERNDPSRQKGSDARARTRSRLVQSKINDAANHSIAPPCFAAEGVGDHLISGLDARNDFLHVAGKHLPVTTSRRLKCPALIGV